MINSMMNQKRGLTDRVSCPTIDIPGRPITNSGAREKHQLNPGLSVAIQSEIAHRLRLNLTRSRYGTRDGQNYNDKDLGIAIRGNKKQNLDPLKAVNI